MQRILYVANCIPFEHGGGSQATTAYLDAVLDIFGRNQVDVMLSDKTVIPSSYKDVNFIKIPQRNKWFSRVGFLIGKMGRFVDPAYKFLKTNEDVYSHCIFNCGRESGWLAYKLRSSKIKIVTIHHNQEVEYCMDNKTLDTLYGHWPYTVRFVESRAYRYSDLNMFLTQQDMDAFEHQYGKSKGYSYVIGTFDFKDAEKINITNEKKGYDIAISGSLNNYQTIHGVVDFYSRYFDAAREIIPNVSVLLTGRSPSKEIYNMADLHPDVFTIIPSPFDIQAEVRRGHIYLCPTDIGGGLKLRVMDGLKNGLPVLVHEISARGYDPFFQSPYFSVYCDEDSFKNGLKQILCFISQNPHCAELINSDYYNYFGYEKGTERFKKALNLLTN